MNKKDDINKNSIIVGITSAAIIAIAIIAVIGIFTIKSQAQVKKDAHNSVALSSLKESAVKLHKDAYKVTEKQVQAKDDHVWGVASKVKQHWAKDGVKNAAVKTVKNQYKDDAKLAVLKTKDWFKQGAAKSVKGADKLVLHKGFHEKEEAV